MSLWPIWRRPTTRLLCLRGLLALASKPTLCLILTSRIWLESEMRPPPPLTHLVSHPRHLMPRDGIHASATCWCSQEAQTRLGGVEQFSLSYEVVVCTYTALWWSPSNGMFFILWGFRTKDRKTTYRTASLYKITTYINFLQPGRRFFPL